MSKQYNIAVIGAGPAGLSAAARAAELDAEDGATEPSYILLEGFSTFAKTIQRYQKGKHVMAEPGFLALRSPMPFAAGTREAILDAWKDSLTGLNVRYDSEVTGISGERGAFSVALGNGESIQAAHLVLSIGTQGNPRALGVDGDTESDFVRYTLDDPAAFSDETIVVVGAGDAAIENAIALAEQNTVYIINRRAEFSRAKDGNLSAVLGAINDRNRAFYCRYESSVKALQVPASDDSKGAIVLSTPAGEESLVCDRIIARLGTVPPRRFIESCGISLPSEAPDAIPDVDARYQSNVSGLYIIGALGGYPLIKQAMNQGYEVVEFIHDRPCKPADYPLLQEQFSGLPYALDPEDVLALYQQRIPMFRHMNPLAFRELVIESRILVSVPPEELGSGETAGARSTAMVAAGQPLYEDGDYGSEFYTLVEGSVTLQLERDGPRHQIEPGRFFGEMSLISGRPRHGTAVVSQDAIIIETPRRIMVKLMNSNEDVRAGIDRVFITRALQAAFRPALALDEINEIAGRVTTRTYEAGATLYSEGETGETLHLLRSGTVVQSRGDRDLVIAQIHSGELVGQLALMGAPKRRETARAAVRTETLEIAREEFLRLVGSQPEYVDVLKARASKQLSAATTMASRPEAARAIGFLMDQGLGEATNTLIIDESLCVGCDNCEKACAETHDGISRLDRAQGPAFSHLHVPVSCRHCEVPHCMKDCPPDAIRRSPHGEVFIADTCIGCGNCETNCPYDAISMRYPTAPKPGLFAWLLFGLGPGPGDAGGKSDPNAVKKATKCDACVGQRGGPACVRACPTGAALRVGPEQFIELVEAAR